MQTEIKWEDIPIHSGKILRMVDDNGDETRFSFDIRENRFTLIREVALHIPYIYMKYNKNDPPENVKIFIDAD